MSTETEDASQSFSTTSRKDVYQSVTERITTQLEQGTVPWRKPWTEAGVPRNAISQRPYRGINLILLSMLGYDNNVFLTFKQVRDLGGAVRRGEPGHIVVYWNWYETKDSSSTNTNHEPYKPKKIPLLRYYTVFNISQCDNLPQQYYQREERNWQPIEACEDIISKMPKKPKITHKQQRAFYDPLRDYVNMPKYNTFERPEAYYATLLHELIHSTGHESRLQRKGLLQMAEFGSEPYSHEELVAEIGSCYLQAVTGITSEFEQSAAYIQNWLIVLRNDSRFIFSASADAQKSTDFILGVTENQ